MPAYKDVDRGTWYISCRYKGNRGTSVKKTKRGFATKKEALEWERNFLAGVNADMTMLLKTFVDIYFEDKENRLKERSIQNKKYMIKAKILPMLGDKPMCSITARDILHWQNAMLEQGYSDTYLRMLQNQVTAIFNHAEKIYNLSPNPCKKIEKIGKANAKGIDFWTIDEFKIFSNSFTDDELMYKALFDILFWSGCRLGECLALTGQDINFINKEIHISKTYYRHERKDIVTVPKTEGSVRTVSIPDFLCEELKEYMQRSYGLKNDERIFPIIDRTVQKKMKLTSETIGLKHIRVHDLRHSHVALLIEKGISPLAIAERVGHESINTTLNVYGHLYPNKQREIADILQKIKIEK